MTQPKALEMPEKCPDCPDQGWYASGADLQWEQLQCEFCYRNPNSLFNVSRAMTALGWASPDRVKILTDALENHHKEWVSSVGCLAECGPLCRALAEFKGAK